MLTHFSLFTGIGGIDLAAEWAGFETVGQCEWADYPTSVLEKHWPDVPRWRDVKDVTAESIREQGIADITLLSGGFPCQPHSVAGERKGSADERDLWGEFARVICETKPRWVLGENVPGLYTTEDGRFFGRILNDLAETGYSVGWCCYGANVVGAPHKRDRVFIIAYPNSFRPQRRENARGIRESKKNSKKQLRGLYQALLRNTDSEPELQTNTTTKPFGGERSARKGTAWEHGRKTPGTYWEISEPPVLGVDDGLSNRVDRSIALGNAVVPQQVYPILQAIADIEGAPKKSGNEAKEGG